MWDVVDLGAKKGHAIDAFRRSRNQFFADDSPISPDRCLAIDRKIEYWGELESKGYKPLELDLASDEAIANLPEANYYLAWHFLEHVPSKEWSDKIVKAALSKAKYGCWFVLPSFEPDTETGEGALRALGLRWSWSHWIGHPTHYLVQECKDAVNEWFDSEGENLEKGIQVRVLPSGGVTRDTNNHRVVFIDAPIDTTEHDPELEKGRGRKPLVHFDPPLIEEWSVVVRF